MIVFMHIRANLEHVLYHKLDFKYPKRSEFDIFKDFSEGCEERGILNNLICDSFNVEINKVRIKESCILKLRVCLMIILRLKKARH